uniref:Uncharacterized protein n=2 Tax=Physcomitrium patens TaxID=3218 RepID=A0A7I4A015_PHYPA
MAAMGVVAATSAQASCRLLSSSFRKDSSCSCNGDLLDSSHQECFVGSPRSMAMLRRDAIVRKTSRPVSATNAFLTTSFPGNFMADVEQDDMKKDLNEDDDENESPLSSSCEFLESVNSVIADVVDGQKYLKETGRTKPRPMKRRSLVVCMVMSAIQPYLSDVENRMGNLRRTTSSSFAKTCRLVSQLSFGASKTLSSIVDDQRKSEAEQCVPAAA